MGLSNGKEENMMSEIEGAILDQIEIWGFSMTSDSAKLEILEKLEKEGIVKSIAHLNQDERNKIRNFGIQNKTKENYPETIKLALEDGCNAEYCYIYACF